MTHASADKRWLIAVFTIAAALAAQSVLAQPPQRGCPPGQAIQSTDPSGKNPVCIPVADPDAALLGAIADEANARRAADDELRASIGGETSIVGTYTFTGTQACVQASLGFNPDLTPVPAIFDPGGNFIPNNLSQSTAAVWGSRTFDADGTGTSEFNTQSLSFGGASESFVTGTFTWAIVGDRLIIDDGDAAGTIVRGSPRVGWTVLTQGVPRAVGILGKDLKVFSILHEEMKVEIGITRSPDGATQFTSQRICHRERTLRKM